MGRDNVDKFHTEPEKTVQDDIPIEDPFSPENAPAFTLITLMRIYDVLMAQFNASNPDAAAKLVELHAKGKLLGSFPWLDPDE